MSDDYERKVLENRKRNEELLASLALTAPEERADMVALSIQSNAAGSTPSSERKRARPSKSHNLDSAEKDKRALLLPTRRSRRLVNLPARTPQWTAEDDDREQQEVIAAALAAKEAEQAEKDAMSAQRLQRAQHKAAVAAAAANGIELTEETYESQEFFALRDQKVLGIVVEGHFRGWVNPDVCSKFGIARSEAELPSSAPSKVAGAKGRAAVVTGSTAKVVSSKHMYTNPNSYFFRHLAPGETKWTGPWTDEEHKLFLHLARTLGCGDRWGLFSSYFKHRVGYQCRNYYAAHILTTGEVFDPHFRLTQHGKAVYVGELGKSGSGKKGSKGDDDDDDGHDDDHDDDGENDQDDEKVSTSSASSSSSASAAAASSAAANHHHQAQKESKTNAPMQNGSASSPSASSASSSSPVQLMDSLKAEAESLPQAQQGIEDQYQAGVKEEDFDEEEEEDDDEEDDDAEEEPQASAVHNGHVTVPIVGEEDVEDDEDLPFDDEEDDSMLRDSKLPRRELQQDIHGISNNHLLLHPSALDSGLLPGVSSAFMDVSSSADFISGVSADVDFVDDTFDKVYANVGLGIPGFGDDDLAGF